MNIGAESAEPGQGVGLVRLDQARIADHISDHDCQHQPAIRVGAGEGLEIALKVAHAGEPALILGDASHRSRIMRD
jgi:hypothetical protein